MRGQADPVPQAVPVRRPTPVLVDHGARDRVECLAARDRGTRRDRDLQRADRGRLGPRDELVDREIAVIRLPHEQGPRHVAPIARHLRAEVEQQHRPVEHGPIAGRTMWQRRFGAGEAGHVEGKGFRAAGSHQHLELPCELGLGDARTDRRQQAGEGAIRHGRCGRNPLDLGRCLRRPIGLDPAFDRDELHVRRGRLEPPPEGVADEPCLDADPARPERGEELRPPRGQVGGDRLVSGFRGLASRLDRVPAVGQDDDLVASDEELARVPGDLLLAVPQAEPGEVAHVLRPRAEVDVEAVAGEALPDPGHPVRSCRAIGISPAGQVAGGGRRREVRGLGPAAPARGLHRPTAAVT